jgi:predicted dienelactone hydrolase
MIFVLLACTEAKQVDSAQEERTEHLSWSVEEKGPFQVGYTTREATYTLLSEERSTQINIWYPTTDTQGEEAVYFSLVEDESSFVDASWAEAATDIGFPVLVFSHGSFLYGGSSSFLPRHFASHGWVVVAPDHTGHLLTDYGDPNEASTFYLRSYNNKASVDVLSEFDSVHTEEIVLSGFSFGATDNWMSAGATMNIESITQLCTDGTLPAGCSDDERALFTQGFLDSRIRGIIPMAGADRFDWISTEGRSDISVPVLMISGTEDDDVPETILSEVEGVDITSIEIEGGCHALFSVGGCPDISTEEGYSIVQSESLRFARDILFLE